MTRESNFVHEDTRSFWPSSCSSPVPVSSSFLKEIVHPKIAFLSSSTHPHAVPNPYEFLYYVEHKISHFEEYW